MSATPETLSLPVPTTDLAGLDRAGVERLAFQDRQGIVGQSTAIRELVDVLMQVAPTDITVLVTGESGVGKEIIARALHSAGRRAGGRLVVVNCGAIPEGLLESELFGHEKGAFTGATEQRKGYFEQADKGTIFLDEVGELPPATQVKFLRVLETGEFMRVGGNKTISVDVRIVAATNKRLEDEVRRGTFREDLYYRLRAVNLFLPPLRERRADIAPLFNKFVHDYTRKHHLPFGGLTTSARALLEDYGWPGNVRELRNVVETLVVLERGHRVDGAALTRYLRREPERGDGRSLPTLASPSRPGHSSGIDAGDRDLLYRALIELRQEVSDLKTLIRAALSGSYPDITDRTDAPIYRPMADDDRDEATFAESTVLPDEDDEADSEMSAALGDPTPEPTATASATEPAPLSLEQMERRMIEHSLVTYEGNRRRAAQALNISERTLYRKIKEYDL